MAKKKNTVGIALKVALGQEIPVYVEKRKGFVSLFMNRQRRKLFHYLCNYPGSNMRMISRDMGVGLPSVRWHLDHLMEMGFIEGKSLGKFKVFYPSRFINPDYLGIYALLNTERGRGIFKQILLKGGINHQALSQETGMSPQNLGAWIKKFESLELVAPVKDGRNNRYFATILVSEIEKVERNHRNVFKRYILNKLNQDGVNPKIVESSGTRYVLELKVADESYFLKLHLTPLKTILDGREAFFRVFPPEEKKEKAEERMQEKETGTERKEKTKLKKKDAEKGIPGKKTLGKKFREKLSDE